MVNVALRPAACRSRLLVTPGTRIHAYEITAAIGAGGMGHVYRARDTRLGRDVAIKRRGEGPGFSISVILTWPASLEK